MFRIYDQNKKIASETSFSTREEGKHARDRLNFKHRAHDNDIPERFIIIRGPNHSKGMTHPVNKYQDFDGM